MNAVSLILSHPRTRASPHRPSHSASLSHSFLLLPRPCSFSCAIASTVKCIHAYIALISALDRSTRTLILIMAQNLGGAGSGGIAKVLVVGNVATGKTSVINRFARNKFSKDYQTTIGVDFALKRVRMGATELNVQLWDIAGQERFAGLSRIFYTHAVAAIIVYDVTSRDSFDSVLKWKQDIDAKVFLPSGARIPVLLLGNKADLLQGETPASRCVAPEELNKFVEQHGFFAHAECSAATGANVKEACINLVAKIHQNNQTEMTPPAEQQPTVETQSSQPVSLAQPAEKKGGCCS